MHEFLQPVLPVIERLAALLGDVFRRVGTNVRPPASRTAVPPVSPVLAAAR
jgi:hypothetical protein